MKNYILIESKNIMKSYRKEDKSYKWKRRMLAGYIWQAMKANRKGDNRWINSLDDGLWQFLNCRNVLCIATIRNANRCKRVGLLWSYKSLSIETNRRLFLEK